MKGKGKLWFSAGIDGTKVRMREKASVSSKIVQVLANRQKLELISYVGRETSIGMYHGRWARIRLPDGTAGFVFGAFLKLQAKEKGKFPAFFRNIRNHPQGKIKRAKCPPLPGIFSE